MPRVCLLLLATCAAGAAPATAPAASPLTARFALQLVVTAPGVQLTISADGATDAASHRSRLVYRTSGSKSLRGAAVTDATRGFVLYTRGVVPGNAWERFRGSNASPFGDPGVALRVAAGIRHREAGRHSVTIAADEARRLVPGALRPGELAGTMWLDEHGKLIRFRLRTVLAMHARLTIDERFSRLGEPVAVKLPPRSRVVDPAAATATDQALALVRSAIPALEAWYADRGTYAGATIAKLKRIYDSSLDARHIRVTRAGKASYCVEATAGGRTAHKRGPAGPVVHGRC